MRYFSIILISMLLLACGTYNKALKTSNMPEKYAYAKQYYDAQDYIKAIPLFEELLTHYKGTDSSEMIYYYYAYSHYGSGNFSDASHHFKNFTETFYNSEKIEECYFMYAKCEYKYSQPYNLDQTATKNGIEKLQLFVNLFPESERIPECNKYIDELRGKLKKKAYENAYLYYKIGDFKAAVSALKQILDEFPDLKNEDEVNFLIVKSSYLIAKNSIAKKQKGRYENVLTEFTEIKTTSEYYEDALDYNTKSIKALDKLSKIIIK
jgi:outer membrane protein assembly factor BamD